jgi:predicted RNA-binding protein with TRAM domain
MYLSIGDKLDGQMIVGKGARGNMFIKHRGIIVFIKGPPEAIKNLKEGDKVSIKITETQKNFAEAEVVL